ncbi:hypothetical protein H9Y04_07750 [Streptomyces sp. TRM66268-LWL]|uniref:Uncharacterized protein n=1 Tax=Streptomyces polyasparticus TaxID=2767826 RepID=A0ABR7SCK1_9ACTN|nr:hypothetical protein [Streptomyces polyasparticus]MBC9712465.1 hypothetical protein [Streptomyces polyasparticus]
MNTVDWSRALAGLLLGPLLVLVFLHPFSLLVARIVRGRPLPPPRPSRRACAELDALLGEFERTGATAGTPSPAPASPAPSAEAP